MSDWKELTNEKKGDDGLMGVVGEEGRLEAVEVNLGLESKGCCLNIYIMFRIQMFYQ